MESNISLNICETKCMNYCNQMLYLNQTKTNERGYRRESFF